MEFNILSEQTKKNSRRTREILRRWTPFIDIQDGVGQVVELPRLDSSGTVRVCLPSEQILANLIAEYEENKVDSPKWYFRNRPLPDSGDLEEFLACAKLYKDIDESCGKLYALKEDYRKMIGQITGFSLASPAAPASAASSTWHTPSPECSVPGQWDIVKYEEQWAGVFSPARSPKSSQSSAVEEDTAIKGSPMAHFLSAPSPMKLSTPVNDMDGWGLLAQRRRHRAQMPFDDADELDRMEAQWEAYDSDSSGCSVL